VVADLVEGLKFRRLLSNIYYRASLRSSAELGRTGTSPYRALNRVIQGYNSKLGRYRLPAVHVCEAVGDAVVEAVG